MGVTYDKIQGKPLLHKHKADDVSDVLKLDQSTPQTVTGGTPNLNLDNASAPTGQADGYLAVVDETLWYFAGGNRYKITATLDNPVAATDRYASLWFLFGNVHD